MGKKNAFEAGNSGVSAVENVESLSEWRDLKETAPLQAEHEIANIEGFEDMTDSEKVFALKSLLETLANDNANRFVVEVIAHRLTFIEEMAREERHLAELGVAA